LTQLTLIKKKMLITLQTADKQQVNENKKNIKLTVKSILTQLTIKIKNLS
jgi:hypothetical protein